MDFKKIAAGFSRRADNYDSQALLQAEIIRDLMTYMPDRKVSRLMDIGCGTGNLLARLLERYPLAVCTGIDLSAAMIKVARGKLPEHSVLVSERFESYDDMDRYDLIVSSSTLHWLNDLNRCFKKIAKFLRPGGNLVIATFVEGSMSELDVSFSNAYQKLSVDKGLQHVISFAVAQDVLSELGRFFVIEQSEIKSFTYRFSSPREALASIKDVGAGYSVNNGLSFSENKQLFKHVFKIYSDMFSSPDGLVPLSWKVLFVRAVLR